MPIDYYKLLGISSDASDEEIRSAYYGLVKKIHPDKFSPNTTEWREANLALSLLNEAYSVLRDVTSRRNYDKLRCSMQSAIQRENSNSWTSYFSSGANVHIKYSTSYSDANQYTKNWRDNLSKFIWFFNESVRFVRFLFSIIALICFIGFVIYAMYTKERSEEKREQEIASWSIPAQMPPASGSYLNAIGRQGEAPFEIKSSGTGYYFIKLVEFGTNKTVQIFVHAGRTLEIPIPLGTYEMKYAYGDTWYGENYLFGPETVYSKSDSIFDFYQSGTRISGYSVTLYKVSGGNMRTHEITAAEF